MKKDKALQAKELRKNGKSIREIANELNVAKSSVSVWVRDIPLSKEQLENLCKPRGFNYKFFRNKRAEYQKEGINKAKEKDINHAIGCMLYWAEGTKARNTLSFTNSDVNVHKTFLCFLRKYFNIPNNKIAISVNCYLDHGLSIDQIYNYWIDALELKDCVINKASIRDPLRSSFSSGKKTSKLKYGVLRISTGNSQILQHIYGAIQEYCGFQNELWLTK